MTAGAQIVATGVHVPRSRLKADDIPDGAAHSMDGDAIRVPSADEDSLTMAIAAARDALKNASGAGIQPHDIAYLGIASTTPPVEEGAFTSRAARALGLSTAVRTDAVTQDTAAGADALATAASVAAAGEGPALAVAADTPRGHRRDARDGAGAAGFLFVQTDHPAADENQLVHILDRADHADEYPGIRYRNRGKRNVESLDITTYERTAVTTCLRNAIDDLAIDVDDVDMVTFHQPTAKMASRTTGALPLGNGIREAVVADRIGDAGAASVPIALLLALTEAHQNVTTVAGFFGSGARAVALAFEGAVTSDVTDRLETGTNLSYAEYVRLAALDEPECVAGGGAHVSIPSWRRSLDARYRLVAGKCPHCGGLTFPAEGACRSCGDRVEFEPVTLPREGSVVTGTVIGDGNAPPEFVPLQQRVGSLGVVIVELEADGETVLIPAQLTDCEPENVDIGDAVKSTVRRIYTQDGVTRYGVKFTPA